MTDLNSKVLEVTRKVEPVLRETETERNGSNKGQPNLALKAGVNSGYHVPELGSCLNSPEESPDE